MIRRLQPDDGTPVRKPRASGDDPALVAGHDWPVT